MITGPFPPQNQQLFQHITSPLHKGNATQHDHAKTSTAQVIMFNETLFLTTRSKTYNAIPNKNTNEGLKGKTLMDETSFTPPPTSPL